MTPKELAEYYQSVADGNEGQIKDLSGNWVTSIEGPDLNCKASYYRTVKKPIERWAWSIDGKFCSTHNSKTWIQNSTALIKGNVRIFKMVEVKHND